jgi:hypothetical protein
VRAEVAQVIGPITFHAFECHEFWIPDEAGLQVGAVAFD